GKADKEGIWRHAADPGSQRPKGGFKRDQEGQHEGPEPEGGPTRAQDVEARACHDKTTEYRTGRQVDRQSVEHVEEEARSEEQRERARSDVRPHRLQRDVRTTR